MGGCLKMIGGFVALLCLMLTLDALFDSALRVVLAVVALFGLWLTWTCGAALAGRGARPRLSARPDVLRPGQTFTLAYDAPSPTRFRLICRESTRRDAGNGRSVTAEHDWVVEDVAGARHGELEMMIPTDAMHSFATRHHYIAWLVEAQPNNGHGAPCGMIARVELTVLPVPYTP